MLSFSTTHLALRRPLAVAGGFSLATLIGTSAFSPTLAAQQTGVEMHVGLGAAWIGVSSPVRRVPRADGGTRFLRLSGGNAAFSAGAEVSVPMAPIALRVVGLRTLGSTLEQQVHRTHSCGPSCTRTVAEYEYAADAALTVISADIVLAPDAKWRVNPIFFAGVARSVITYGRSSLDPDLEQYVPTSDASYLRRLGIGASVTLSERVKLGTELISHRSASTQIPTNENAWPQEHFVVSSYLTVQWR